MRTVMKYLNAVVSVLLITCAAIALLVVGVRLSGRALLVEHSGSMAPAIEPGDLILSVKIHPTQARVGETVTFIDPYNHSMTLTHRVISVKRDDGVYKFNTKGDANSIGESWSVSSGGTIGLVEANIPKAGYVANWLAQRESRAILILLACVLGTVFFLRRIWASSDDLEQDEEDSYVPRHAENDEEDCAESESHSEDGMFVEGESEGSITADGSRLEFVAES